MNKILFRISFGLLTFLRLLFSNSSRALRCVVCSKKTHLIPVCRFCREKYFSVPSLSDERENFCSICGKRLYSENGKCLECREETVLKMLDGAFPIFSYRLWNESLLCRWKLSGERALSDFFACCVKKRLEDLKNILGDFSVVPVPPRKGKVRKEGWDQIQELSRFLKFLYDVPVSELLERNSFVQQKTLSREERLSTIESAYSLKRNLKIPVPERVVIIDDVMTTGSTLEGIAKILKQNGAKEVYGLTIFTVD